MGKLNKKIHEWVKNNIITQSDANNILKYENKKESNYVSYITNTILGIASFAIVIGIIAITAANWHKIPSYLKLTINFMMHLFFISYIYYLLKIGKKKLLNVFLFIEFGMIIASIALIGQIYQLDGHLFRSISFWLFLGTPLLLLSRSHYISYTWTILITICCFLGIDFFYDLFLPEAILIIPFILLYLSYLFKKLNKDFFFQATKKIGILLFVSIVTLGTFFWYQKNHSLEHKEFLFITTFLALLMTLWFIKNKRKDFALLTVLGSIFFLAPQYTIHGKWMSLAIFSFLIFWIALAKVAYLRKNKLIFDIASFLITLRILIIYFEVFGTLLQTGIGLIIGGILTIFIMLLWQKQRKKIWNRDRKRA